MLFFYEELSAPHPTPKLKEHLLLAVCDFVFNIFAATFDLFPSPCLIWDFAFLQLMQ
jgi:hypothetical protein